MSAAPTHIKRPLNAFMVFSQQERAKLSGLYRNNSETSQEIGKRWRELSDEDKAPFYQTAKLLKEQHEKKYPGYKYQPKQKKGKGKDEPSVSARRSAPYTIPPGASSEKPVKIAEDKDEDVYTPSGDQLVADEKQNSDAVSGEGVATTSQAIAAFYMPYQQSFNYYNYQYEQLQLQTGFYTDTTRPTSNGSAYSSSSSSCSSTECGDDVAANFRIDDEPHEYKLENL